MPRKTGREIASGVTNGTLHADEIHDWLSTANVKELQEYIRWVGAVAPTWSAFGRDAMNVLLANENIKLQKAIKDLTIWLFILTLVMVILGAYQIRQNMSSTPQTLKCQCIFPPAPNPAKSADSQTNNTNAINKTNAIKHK